MKFSFKLERRAAQFIKFNIVGLCNTAVDFIVFAAATKLGLPAGWAQLMAYGAGMLNSYYWNGRWTFGRAQASHRSLIFRFIVLNGVLLGLSAIAVTFLAELVPVLEAKIALTCFTVVLNYLGSRSFIYQLGK
jgi:putative flippase GtrA